MTKKIILFIINSIVLTLLFLALTLFDVSSLSNFWKFFLLIVINIIYYLSIILKWFKKYKTSKFLYVIYMLSSILVIGYCILSKYGILETISTVDGLKNYILSTKEKGIYIYIIIQALQVVILPIPAAIICIVGSLIYGPFLGGLYCSLGILIGSFISFFIGKTFGYKIVAWIAGKENTDKYSVIIRKRGGFFLGLAFLLPMFPDDILCLIAGITNMKFKTFAWVTVITRPIGVICMSYFGGGHIIPFAGWGLYVWAVLLVIIVAIVVLIYKYQDQLQEFILSKIVFRKKRNKRNQS